MLGPAWNGSLIVVTEPPVGDNPVMPSFGLLAYWPAALPETGWLVASFQRMIVAPNFPVPLTCAVAGWETASPTVHPSATITNRTFRIAKFPPDGIVARVRTNERLVVA